MKSIIKDIKLAAKGKQKLAWAEEEMPVLMKIREQFKKQQPFKGFTIAVCLHVTKETGVLVRTLKAGGAKLSVCGSNPLSTQDETAAALASEGIPTFAFKGQTNKEYYSCLNAALEVRPHITIDDGADLISLLHSERTDLLKGVVGGQEETTTGVIRLKAMAADGALRYPVVAINDTPTKHMFDNHYGTGQSSLDGILRATNILLAGKTVVVVGYGYCGSGIAKRAHGSGAKIIVTEVDPIAALKATMDGFRVMKMSEAARLGDLFITATGNKHVVTLSHVKNMKDRAIIANAGHFNVEIDVAGIQKAAKKKTSLDSNIDEYNFGSKKVYLLAGGRLVNLAAAEGHPSSVMDMSFSDHALSCAWLVKNYPQLEAKVYDVPAVIDQTVATLKLAAMGVGIDQLTPEQKKYLSSWQEGT